MLALGLGFVWVIACEIFNGVPIIPFVGAVFDWLISRLTSFNILKMIAPSYYGI